MFKHKSHVSVRQRHRVRTHKNHVCRNETDECFEHRKKRPLELGSSISISFNKPLLNWHNGADIKRSWTGGWTRATANSKQALSTEERAGLQISAQSRIQALMAVLRPTITQGGRDRGVWTYPLASESGAVSAVWLYVTLAVFVGSQFTLRGFSWHCALGTWGSKCFSNSPPGRWVCTIGICGGRTYSSALNYEDYLFETDSLTQNVHLCTLSPLSTTNQ